MRKVLLILLVTLTACSEKDSSHVNSKHVKASVAKSATQGTSKVKVRNISMPLVRNKVSVEANEAFLSFYKGTSWAGESTDKYFNERTEYVSLKFEGRFTEGGINKLLVIWYLTPSPLDDFLCHACVPLIGGAIFKQQDSKWIVESAQKIIGWGDVLETGDFNLVQIGPDKYGVSIHITDAHQGYEDDRFEILVPYKGSLITALVDGFYEKPGDAAYIEGNNVELLPQDLSIKFVPGKNPEFYDAVVRARYNDGDSQKLVRKDQTNRYQFHDGKFEPI